MMDKKEFYLKQSQLKTYLILGIVSLTALFIFMLLGVYTVGALGIAGGFGLMYYFWGKDRVIFTFEKDYLEFKLAPLAPLTIIKYCDIISVEEFKANILQLIYNLNGKERKIRIAVTIFEKEEIDNFQHLFLNCKKTV